jgi:hypothetical protein
VGPDCGNLTTLGCQCVSQQFVNISGSYIEQDFAVQASNPQPVLSSANWRTNNFKMLIAGVASQNYTGQMSTNLSPANWTTLYVTNNPAAGSFLLSDPNATNQQCFYRILIGP